MLFPIDNLQSSIIQPATNVPSLGPAIFINQLSCLHRIFQVTLNSIRSFEANL